MKHWILIILATLLAAGCDGGDSASNTTNTVDAAPAKLAVDGEIIIDWPDDAVKYGPLHGGGHFAFRQMKWIKALQQLQTMDG